MPQDTPYATCPSIVVRFNDGDAVTNRADWSAKVVALLDMIHAIPLGAELMGDIAATRHTVYVQPALAQSNQCGAANSNCYVQLRQAYEGYGAVDFGQELLRAFGRAARAGLSIDGIARRLTAGVSPVTVETARNVARPTGTASVYQARKLDRKGNVVNLEPGVPKLVDARLTFESMRELLWGLCIGERKKMELQMARNGRTLADDVIRCFYVANAGVADEFLQRGSGCSATISFKPDVDQSCWLDEHITRPPGIGLVHELIHAWRNVNGTRYFKDKEKLPDAPTPDDEVMTTGFPPYQWEKYSENMFRGLWAQHAVGAINAPGTPLHGMQPLRHKY
jgi:hypothetical protein